MRIINILPTPRHISYASSAPGGRTIRPGDQSPVLPLAVIHTPQLQQDLKTDKIGIRLSVEDKAFVAEMLAADKAPIKVAKLPPKPEPQRKRKRHPKPSMVPMSPEGTPQGQPDISSVPEEPDPLLAVPVGSKPEDFDLATLQRMNRQKKVREIAQHMGGRL
jgi:hypothetical protein